MHVFNLGYDGIITMGNDCPSLTPSMILTAARKLKEGKTVLGPAEDGGVYLIGIHRKDYHPGKFLTLPWLTEKVFESLKNLYSKKDLHFLPVREDLDVIPAAKDIVRQSSFYKRLIRLLDLKPAIIPIPVLICPNESILRFYSNRRAPPLI